MRRLAFALTSICLALLPACGGGGSSAPLDDALGYLPKDAPFVVTVDTDVGGGQFKTLGRLVRRFPFGEQAGERLKRELEGGGKLDFDRDVKPLLGNPFVVGSANGRSFLGGAASDSFVAAVKTKDGDKLKDLVKREGARKQGEKNGATIYRDDQGGYLAVEGDVLVLAGSRELLEAALARRDGDRRLDEKAFSGAMAGLPSQALVRGYVNARGLLRARSQGRQALGVPWVAALREVAFSARAENDGLDVDFNARTDPAKLSSDQLPLAEGDQAPAVLRRPGEVAIGVRDPGQVADFILSAARSSNPRFEAGRAQLEKTVGIDLKRDLIDQLSGGASLNLSAGGQFGLRADVRDPVAFKRTLRKLAAALPRFAKSTGAGTVGIAKPKRGENFYAIARPDGKSVVFGVVGRVLVASTSPARAGRLAEGRPRAVPGARGSFVLDVDAQKLATDIVKRFAPQLGLGSALFTSRLGELTGSASSGKDGVHGRLKLGID
ncbi:MAG: DUF3352 domain-containing protein [Thermoleophilaceae bacterium]